MPAVPPATSKPGPAAAVASRAAHPVFTRRQSIQAGATGLLGLGMNHWQALTRPAAAAGHDGHAAKKSVIFIFLSGGLAQHDSFDPKPQAPDGIRGEFSPVATRTPGVQICEHLPHLARCSHLWSMVRSLTHSWNEHFQAHMIMLTGRSELPRGFNRGRQAPTDWPSIAATAGEAVRSSNNLPPAAILPEALVHKTGFTVGGQMAGLMGSRRDPWTINASPNRRDKSYGAYPEYSFNHLTEAAVNTDNLPFQAPHLSLPEGIGEGRLSSRVSLLETIERQRRELDRFANTRQFDRFRTGALSLLSDERVKWAFDVTRADDAVQERYGRNSFGWSLLMARRLVETGVNFVQVNLGNYNSWDTHGANFRKLRDFLLPPTDLAVSALLEDLEARGLLDSTLVVMAGEFGRTPKISHLPRFYRYPGRDHWGGAQSVLVAGGGVRGGNVVGATDDRGAWPVSQPQTPEALAATIYQSLGIPQTAAWLDDVDRPHHIYQGSPIAELF